MARKSAAQVAKNYSDGITGKGLTNWKLGVSDPRSHPGQAANQNLDKAVRNFSNAVTSGKLAAANTSYTQQEWTQAALTKGAPNYSGSVSRSLPRYQATMSKMLPDIYNLSDQIHQMPKNGVEDSVARSGAWIRGMSAKKGSYN